MMYSAQDMTAETFQGWRLDGLIDELLAAHRADGAGKASRTLLKSKELTVVLTVLPQGHELKEHHAAASLLVVPLRGEVVFTQGERHAPVGTQGSQVLALGQGQVHAVRALTDSAFLLVLGTLHRESQTGAAP